MPRSRSSSMWSMVAPDAVLALDLVDGVDLLRVEEDPLGQRGLAGVDVGGDADVADAFDVVAHADRVPRTPHGVRREGPPFMLRAPGVSEIGGIGASSLRQPNPLDRNRRCATRPKRAASMIPAVGRPDATNPLEPSHAFPTRESVDARPRIGCAATCPPPCTGPRPPVLRAPRAPTRAARFRSHPARLSSRSDGVEVERLSMAFQPAHRGRQVDLPLLPADRLPHRHLASDRAQRLGAPGQSKLHLFALRSPGRGQRQPDLEGLTPHEPSPQQDRPLEVGREELGLTLAAKVRRARAPAATPRKGWGDRRSAAPPGR